MVELKGKLFKGIEEKFLLLLVGGDVRTEILENQLVHRPKSF